MRHLRRRCPVSRRTVDKLWPDGRRLIDRGYRDLSGFGPFSALVGKWFGECQPLNEARASDRLLRASRIQVGSLRPEGPWSLDIFQSVARSGLKSLAQGFYPGLAKINVPP
jgi:hypothetical protein